MFAVSAEIAPTAHGCRARFRFEGVIEAIVVPQRTASERADGLWQTTCCEIFWQPVGDAAYREFNLGPSTRWACYDFDDFRSNGRDGPVDSIGIDCTMSERQFVIEADIAADLPVPADIALNAIVEDAQGNMQYWALAFPAGRPEFHSENCRRLRLAKDSGA